MQSIFQPCQARGSRMPSLFATPDQVWWTKHTQHRCGFSWRRMQSSGNQLAIGNARGTSACFSKSAEMLTSSYQSTGGSHKSTGTLPGRVMKCSRHECVMVQPRWWLFARRCTFSLAVLGLEPQEQYSSTRPRAGKRCNSTSPGIPRRSLIPVLVRPKQA